MKSTEMESNLLQICQFPKNSNLGLGCGSVLRVTKWNVFFFSTYQSGTMVSQLVHSDLLVLVSLGLCLENQKIRLNIFLKTPITLVTFWIKLRIKSNVKFIQKKSIFCRGLSKPCVTCPRHMQMCCTYFVNICKASSSYCSLCSSLTFSRDSSLMKAFEHIPNALLAELVRAGKNRKQCTTHPWMTIYCNAFCFTRLNVPSISALRLHKLLRITSVIFIFN